MLSENWTGPAARKRNFCGTDFAVGLRDQLRPHIIHRGRICTSCFGRAVSDELYHWTVPDFSITGFLALVHVMEEVENVCHRKLERNSESFEASSEPASHYFANHPVSQAFNAECCKHAAYWEIAL